VLAGPRRAGRYLSFDGGFFRRRAFLWFLWTASRSSGWAFAHRHSSVTGSKKTRPNGVKSYSTFGGTSA